MKMAFKNIGYEVMGWIYMPQGRLQLWALVIRVMQLGFHKRLEISPLAERLSALQGEIC
jgi:hypothetical protein